jgi:hypothetical protein
MQPLYTNVKINNEIELCEVPSLECKNAIEKALLQKRISYYVRWLKPSIFKKRHLCVICVNDNVREEAEEVVQTVCNETGNSVRFLMKKSQNHFL